MELQYETESSEQQSARTGLAHTQAYLDRREQYVIPAGKSAQQEHSALPTATSSLSAEFAVRDLLSTLRQIEQKKCVVDQATTTLMQHIRAARFERRKRMINRVIYLMVFVGLCVAARGIIFQNWWLFFVFGGGGEAIDRSGQKRRTVIEALALAGDPRTVGVLAIALTEDMKQDDWALRRALIQLLPRVRANDAAFIGAPQMNALITLAARPALETQIAVLKAFEQIGDARAIPTVERLCTHPDTRVREQAEQTMPHLYERARRASESATLLRGAQAPTLTSPDQLLRPAMSSSQTPAEQLLRPR